jgi:secreted PhoX family phosphatase
MCPTGCLESICVAQMTTWGEILNCEEVDGVLPETGDNFVATMTWLKQWCSKYGNRNREVNESWHHKAKWFVRPGAD